MLSKKMNKKIALRVIEEILKLDLSMYKDVRITFYTFYDAKKRVTNYKICEFDGAIRYIYVLNDSNVLAVAALRRVRVDENYKLSDAVNRTITIELKKQLERWRDFIYMIEIFFPLTDSEVEHFKCNGQIEVQKSKWYRSLHLYYRCEHFEKNVANIWTFSPFD